MQVTFLTAGLQDGGTILQFRAGEAKNRISLALPEIRYFLNQTNYYLKTAGSGSRLAQRLLFSVEHPEPYQGVTCGPVSHVPDAHGSNPIVETKRKRLK
jgi:hypothetical protein